MIRHVVMFTLQASDSLGVVRAALQRLATIPHVLSLEVAENLKTDLIGNEIDLVVHAVFKDRAALDAYHRHPIYQEAIDAVRPLRDQRVAADFVTEIKDL